MNRSSKIKANTKLSRLLTTSNKKKDLWVDSEIDLSLISDNDSTPPLSNSLIVRTSLNETTNSSEINCCLICSILLSLSKVNCCREHLALLTSASSRQINCMTSSRVSDWSELEYHCRSYDSKSKQCPQSRSLSLLSSSFQRRRTKRLQSAQSFNTMGTDDFKLSPNREKCSTPHIESPGRSTTDQQRRLNHVRSPLTPSYASCSSINILMNNNNSRKRTRTLSKSFVPKRKQRNLDQTESPVQKKFNQSISTDLTLSHTPRILLNRVIYVKDEDEDLIVDNSQIILNMSQATKQMIAQENIQPKILLQRVCFEQ